MSGGEAVTPGDVVGFWFSEAVKAKWFDADADFDAGLRMRFEAALGKAKRGELAAWEASAEGMLALVVLLDQIPRNIYRATPEAFATDGQALSLAERAIAAGLDAKLTPEQRIFLYLPFMHSERLAVQERGIALYDELGIAEQIDYMRRHRDVIARFGRFPHRNAILGRVSTEAELAFLTEPGSRF
ncbi:MULTISPECIES: DUF924 family protein [Rhodomicrobium]|uniref:DUF924 family protein n=1 Tax=Rhodomicrobium TaxID=1068 RepID=UPI000B4ABB1C|nr:MULTISPECIES: DUF924 family protein [Rhodomicrobium]